MAMLVSALNHESIISRVVRMVQEQTAPMAAVARSHPEETELALMDLNDRRRAMRSGASEDELHLMDGQAETLACQDEMEGCEFVSDEGA